MNNVSYKSHLVSEKYQIEFLKLSLLTNKQTGSEEKFEQLYVSGKNIRYINIPDHINIIKTVEEYVSRFRLAFCYSALLQYYSYQSKILIQQRMLMMGETSTKEESEKRQNKIRCTRRFSRLIALCVQMHSRHIIHALYALQT